MQKYTNKGSVPWHPKESRTPCKNALNDSTIASSISWWQGWHLFHCIFPMSLQDGKKKMEKHLYRQTTVGYWFCMFVTSSLSRRTVLQINLCQLHSVPWHAWFQNKIERYKFERYNDSRSIFLSTAHAFQWKHHICFFRAIHHIDPLHRKQTLTLSQCNSRDLTDSPYRNLEKCKKC